jgi:hypothetical protein
MKSSNLLAYEPQDFRAHTSRVSKRDYARFSATKFWAALAVDQGELYPFVSGFSRTFVEVLSIPGYWSPYR